MESARVRSVKKGRLLVDRAAAEIAASPTEWRAIVNTVRVLFGQTQLPAEVETGEYSNFVKAELAGVAAAYPIFRLKTVDGGGMNTVLRSRELFLGREIAVRKHLPAESAEEESYRDRRESLVKEHLSKLPRHPAIPRFWLTGAVDGERCEIFDFAPGTSLVDHALKKGLTYEELLDVGAQAARALLYLHRHGLIHADIKPQNFCVEERTLASGATRLKLALIDFDTISSPEEQLRQYALGNALDGTLPYMPPENFCQILPEDADEARRMVFSKDVFALGLSLYRIVTGRFPDSFYTSVHSLLEKKAAAEPMELPFPEGFPATFQELVVAMCASDFRARPTLPQVIRLLDGLRQAASAAERAWRVVQPGGAPPPAAPAPEPREDRIGPFRVLDRAFAPRVGADGQELPLASMEDRFGRKLVGVPFAFWRREDEEAFYEERRALLADLNAVRLKHPELFPGSFRDLVREEAGGQFRVWIVRPLLEGAMDLTRFLAEERPDAPVKERVAILRRVAESFAVLEEAGYTLPRLSPELVFFVPQPLDTPHVSEAEAALTRPIQRLFDIRTGRQGTRFRQELMGTASARRIAPGDSARLVADLLKIAQEIGVFRDLSTADQTFLIQISGNHTWRERMDLLVWVEMQCGG